MNDGISKVVNAQARDIPEAPKSLSSKWSPTKQQINTSLLHKYIGITGYHDNLTYSELGNALEPNSTVHSCFRHNLFIKGLFSLAITAVFNSTFSFNFKLSSTTTQLFPWYKGNTCVN